MSRRGTSCRRNKTANTEMNMEEYEAQFALEVEVEASNIEENQPDKPAYTENVSIQEMIRIMTERLKEEIKDNSKKMEEKIEDTNKDVYKRQHK